MGIQTDSCRIGTFTTVFRRKEGSGDTQKKWKRRRKDGMMGVGVGVWGERKYEDSPLGLVD